MGEEKEWGEYVLACFECGAKKELIMMPYRHRESDDIVGWVNVCGECYSKLAGSSLQIGIIKQGE